MTAQQAACNEVYSIYCTNQAILKSYSKRQCDRTNPMKIKKKKKRRTRRNKISKKCRSLMASKKYIANMHTALQPIQSSIYIVVCNCLFYFFFFQCFIQYIWNGYVYSNIYGIYYKHPKENIYFFVCLVFLHLLQKTLQQS